MKRRPSRPIAASPAFWTLLFAVGISTAVAMEIERPVVTIGIVYDGPPPDEEVVSLQSFWGVPELIRAETLALTRRDFDVRFPEEKVLWGDWDLDRIHDVVDRMLTDPEVDLVLALGVFSSNDVCRRRRFEKPVIAPFAIDVLTQSLPFDGGASGFSNLNYQVRRGSVLQDLRKFRELIPFSTVHILVDSLLVDALPEMPSFSEATASQLGAQSRIVPSVDSADAVLAATAGAEAVYITPLLRMPASEYERLLQGLIERKIPTFSLQGEIDVERGWLAGLRRKADTSGWARRVASNIQRILLGEDAGSLPVTLDHPEKLIINMRTAEAIGFYPTWRVTREAELIQDGGSWGHSISPETLTLAGAVIEAVETNLSLAAAARRVAAGEENIRLARALLRPQIESSTTGTWIDEDRAEASFGSQAERTAGAGVSATQVLYSDDASAGVEIATHGQRSVEAGREIDRLDVALDAAVSFLNVLRARTLDRIEFDNLGLTEENLELARRRKAVGFSGPAEVYRWESALATGRSNSIKAHAQVHSAFVRLNQVLHRPQEDLYTLVPPELAGTELTTGFGRLNPYIDNQRGFDLFRDFSVREGLVRSPELRAIEAAIAAEARENLAARRSFRLPTFSAFADVDRTFSRGGAGDVSLPPSADRDDWSVGLRATLPLYSGGSRAARARQSSEEVSRLRFEGDALAEQVELRIRSALYAVAGTFPAIELAGEAADAARRNLELVTDSYSRGVVSVIDLLDAQNAALVSEQAAANAVYDFLLDLMELKRSTSDFDFFRSAEGREAWFDRLDAFFAEADYAIPRR